MEALHAAAAAAVAVAAYRWLSAWRLMSLPTLCVCSGRLSHARRQSLTELLLLHHRSVVRPAGAAPALCRDPWQAPRPARACRLPPWRRHPSRRHRCRRRHRRRCRSLGSSMSNLSFKRLAPQQEGEDAAELIGVLAEVRGGRRVLRRSPPACVLCAGVYLTPGAHPPTGTAGGGPGAVLYSAQPRGLGAAVGGAAAPGAGRGGGRRAAGADCALSVGPDCGGGDAALARGPRRRRLPRHCAAG